MHENPIPTSTSRINKLIKAAEVISDTLLYPVGIAHFIAYTLSKPPFEIWEYPFPDIALFNIVAGIGWSFSFAVTAVGSCQLYQKDYEKGVTNIVSAALLAFFTKNQFIVNKIFGPEKPPIFLANAGFILAALCDVITTSIDYYRAIQKSHRRFAADRLIEEEAKPNEIPQEIYTTRLHLGFKALTLFGMLMNNLPILFTYANLSPEFISLIALWVVPIGITATGAAIFYNFYKHRTSIAPRFFQSTSFGKNEDQSIDDIRHTSAAEI